MANKKKAATTVVAVATAAALLLGGTFAWQSISQRALNEASDVINPGGRLHNDLWYVDAKTTNNDIYVENFTDPDADGDDIYARVRLSEYMEIVMNYGTAAEKVETVAGSKLDGEGNAVTDKATDNTSGYEYDYTIHYFGEENATDTYWEWTMGNEDSETVYYMPTFNLNKDSLAPDLNGLYRDRVGGISDREAAQYHTALDDTVVPAPYEVNGTKDGFEIYDGDTNSDDELKALDAVALEEIIANGTEEYVDNIVLTDEKKTHTADTIDTTRGLISMADWLDMVGYDGTNIDTNTYDEAEHGNYWVYDTDGWVYWSGAIGAGETTGLLLDSFTLNQVMDDTWYYAIEAEGEFVTADDLGEYNPAAAASTFNLRSAPVASPSDLTYYNGGTGFYENGISKEAIALLAIIGVDVYGEAEDEGEGEEEDNFVDAGTLTGINMSLYSDNEYIKVNESTNTLSVDPEDSWQKVLVNLEHDTLNIQLGDTERAIYEWNDETGAYEEQTDFIVDIDCYEDGLDLYLGSGSAGRYKLTASYDDGEGNTYDGSIEFTIVVDESAGDDGDDTSAMTFTSSEELHDEGTTTPYIEIKKNRTDAVEWNLWDCSEGEFTLTSDNEDVWFIPYGDESGEPNNTGADMYVIIPTSVTEDFTVTAKAVNSDKTVVFTVVMKDNEALSYFSASYAGGEVDGNNITINHTVIVNEDYADKVDHSTEYALSVTAYDGDDNEISADYSVLLKSLEVTDGYVAYIDEEENCVGNVKRDGYPHSAVSIYDGDLTIEALYDTLDEYDGELLFNDDLTVTYTLEICDNNSDVTTEIYVMVNIDVIPPSLTLEEARVAISASPVGTPVRIDNNDWYIIAKEGDNALLYHASAIVIDKEFDDSSNSWADSDLRAWLNGECLDGLTVLKQMAVAKTIYTADKYDRSGSYVETKDKVFFLSEADLFGTANGTETIEVKEYTMGTAEKVFPDGILGGSEYYWLRSPYNNAGGVATVLRGEPLFDSYRGDTVDCRPAIWITTAE